ncbi:MAG: diacylglycerol kinase family lipid kinase [Chloroflexi bacterium]|nr:diacylglycerol kinase family lipid kinase [Chloroflexota bacterium]
MISIEAPEVLQRREALVIVNPIAHNAPGRKRLSEANTYLKDLGWSIEWVWTTKSGDATEIAARAADQRTPLVLVCAGDGTLNEAVNGLAGSGTAISVIPAGTSDLWAREAGIPRNPIDAVRVLERSVPHAIDIGLAGDRYFLLMAGFGVDASIIQNTSVWLKHKVGAAAYVAATIREVFRYKGRKGQIQFDNETLPANALMVLAGNTQRYAGITKITPKAKINDGMLDVFLYEGQGLRDLLLHALRTMVRLHLRSPKTTFRRVKRLRLDFDPPLPLQIDGDYWPGTHLEARAVPGGLFAMIPAEVKSRLLADL